MQADATVKPPVIKQEGPLKCQFCDYGAEKMSNLKNHTLNHFKDVLFPLLPKSIPFLCPECNAPHRDKITLLRHFSWSHQMFYRYGSKEDLVPRPQDQPIRDPKSAKPSNVTTEPYVPKVFSVPSSQPASDPLETKSNILKKDPLEAKANLQQRLARVSEQFATNSKKDPLETNNDSKKDSAQNYNGIPCELDLVQLEIPKKDDKMPDAPTLDAPLHVQQQRQPPDAKEILVNATINLREYKLPYGWSKKLSRRRSGLLENKWDAYLTSPKNEKFRSNREIESYLRAHPEVEYDPEVTTIQKPKDDPFFSEISGLQKKSSGSGAGRPANKKKRTKVEGQPKRPSSAYFIWMNEVRAKIKAELPSEASIGDISKFAGERWKSMTDDDKKVS